MTDRSAGMRVLVADDDTVGRYGGEEFLLVLPSCGHAHAGQLAERLRRMVSGEPVISEEGAIRVTASIGVATAVPPSGWPEGYEALIRRADKALYRAKAAGRNAVELAGDGLGPAAPPGPGEPIDALDDHATGTGEATPRGDGEATPHDTGDAAW